MSWAARFGDGDLALSAITVQEIEFGIHRLPQGRRRTNLTRAWAQILGSYDGVVLPFDQDCATVTGQLLAALQRRGRRMPLVDAQIAGTCRAYGATLATRNLRDFASVPDLPLTDPFSSR